MRLILDASAAVNALVPSMLRDPTRRRFEGAELFAPSLIDTEVLSALARLERGGAISTDEADRAVEAWSSLPCQRVDTQDLLNDIWSFRRSVRISDAHYIVLARMLGSPVLTADGRLARAGLRDVSVLLVT